MLTEETNYIIIFRGENRGYPRSWVRTLTVLNTLRRNGTLSRVVRVEVAP